MGRNKKIFCDLCNKEFRSDKLKKHKEVCMRRILARKDDKLLLDCEYCHKHYERHYVKKHMEICKKKRNYKPKGKDIKSFFKNKKTLLPVSNPFVITEADQDEVVEISDDEHEEENEEDRLFIDDGEISDDAESHRKKDNDEVRERLRALGMKITSEIPEKCKWCGEEQYNLAEHEEKCDKKTYNCFNCGEKFPAFVIKGHYRLCKKLIKKKPTKISDVTTRCYFCKKDISISVIKAHSKECKENNPPPKKKKTTGKKKNDPKKKSNPKKKKKKGKPEDPEDEDEKKARIKKGKFFKLNFHGAKKYKILKRLLIWKAEKNQYQIKDWIEQIVIGNEFGSAPRPHPHCHAVITTKDKMNFDEFKKQWKKETRIKIADIQRAKHFSTDVKYVTKEDYRPVIFNIDWDLTSVSCRAYVTAEKYDRLYQRTYPYVALNTFQKSCFKNQYDEFLLMRKEDGVRHLYDNVVLRRWQRQLLTLVTYQNVREIYWIVDPIGNNGKTFMSYYLQDLHGAMRVPNPSSTDFAFAYDYQNIVVFDYNRVEKKHINYSLLEDLKNGSLWSPKYMSNVKSFREKNIIVVCFANYPPDFSALSHDRWTLFELNDNKLKRVKVPEPIITEPAYIVEDTVDLSQFNETPTLPTFEIHEVDEEVLEPARAFPVGKYIDGSFIVIENQ